MWQPAETAPEHKTVLICNPSAGRYPVLAWREGDEWVDRSIYGTVIMPRPTHWMPLPELPELPKSSSQG